jgi:exonuclease III
MESRMKKRFAFLEFLNLMGWDVVLIQETHVNTEEEIEQYKSEWKGKSFWSKSVERNSSVAILVKGSVNIDIIGNEVDNSGRLMCLDCSLNGEKLESSTFIFVPMVMSTQNNSS